MGSCGWPGEPSVAGAVSPSVATPPPGTPNGSGASGCGVSGVELIDEPVDGLAEGPVGAAGVLPGRSGVGVAAEVVVAGAVTPPTWVCKRS